MQDDISTYAEVSTANFQAARKLDENVMIDTDTLLVSRKSNIQQTAIQLDLRGNDKNVTCSGKFERIDTKDLDYNP